MLLVADRSLLAYVMTRGTISVGAVPLRVGKNYSPVPVSDLLFSGTLLLSFQDIQAVITGVVLSPPTVIALFFVALTLFSTH